MRLRCVVSGACVIGDVDEAMAAHATEEAEEEEEAGGEVGRVCEVPWRLLPSFICP